MTIDPYVLALVALALIAAFVFLFKRQTDFEKYQEKCNSGFRSGLQKNDEKFNLHSTRISANKKQSDGAHDLLEVFRENLMIFGNSLDKLNSKVDHLGAEPLAKELQSVKKELTSTIESTKDLVVDLNNGVVEQITKIREETPRCEVNDNNEAVLFTRQGQEIYNYKLKKTQTKK